MKKRMFAKAASMICGTLLPHTLNTLWLPKKQPAKKWNNIMGLFGIKISGNKVTVKRPAPQSPANVRPVTPKQGNNPAHTHVNVPPSLAKKMTGGK